MEVGAITLQFCSSNAHFVLNTGVKFEEKDGTDEEAESTVSVLEVEYLTPGE